MATQLTTTSGLKARTRAAKASFASAAFTSNCNEMRAIGRRLLPCAMPHGRGPHAQGTPTQSVLCVAGAWGRPCTVRYF